MARASCIETSAHVAKSRSATGGGTSRASRSAAPHGGEYPSSLWMNRSRAPSAPMRQSHASARSIPPPTAWPFSMATVGTSTAAMRSSAAEPRPDDLRARKPGDGTEVGARREDPPAGAGDGDEPHLVIGGQLLDRLGEGLERLQREGVLGRAAAQREEAETTPHGPLDGGRAAGRDLADHLEELGLRHPPVALDAAGARQIVELVEQRLDHSRISSCRSREKRWIESMNRTRLQRVQRTSEWVRAPSAK